MIPHLSVLWVVLSAAEIHVVGDQQVQYHFELASMVQDRCADFLILVIHRDEQSCFILQCALV